jgi:alanine racemase
LAFRRLKAKFSLLGAAEKPVEPTPPEPAPEPADATTAPAVVAEAAAPPIETPQAPSAQVGHRADPPPVPSAAPAPQPVPAPATLPPAATLPAPAAPPFKAEPAPVAKPAPTKAVPAKPEPADPLPIGAAGPAELETGGLLTVDLAALVKNWKALAQRVVPADCAAVVKADAYGCGIEMVAGALAKAGCATFFVAHLAEARQVRKAAPEAAIYVLSGFAPGSAPAFAELNARPVIGSLAEFVEWDAFRTASSWRGSAALHFDTGMNRLGLAIEEAVTFTARVKMPDHGIALIMSHLACADTPNHELNAKQIAAFRDLRFMFRGTPTSLANSSGIFLGPAAHCDMVRPGAALFGVNPTPATQNLMEPVVTLKARVVQVRDVPRGATVGYGAAWTAPRASRVAMVSVGYGDGYLRSASTGSGKGFKSEALALIANRRCNLVGRVSMDLMAFDVTGLPEDLVRRGTYATLIGDGLTVDDLARWSGTIGYEVLTGLGQRYRRVWKR